MSGKTDNCQVAVFATLGYGRFSTPIDYRLYLPKSWTDDEERCLKAKVPADKIIFKTKHEQALEMVFHARKNGVRFNWVGCDGLYGSNPQFLRKLDDNDETFMADVHKDQIIYTEDPNPVVPKAKSNKGKRPSRLKAQTQDVRVDKWMKQQPNNAWKRTKVRKTTKGQLIVDILHREVWLWDGKEAEARKWHLVVRREINSPGEIKYRLSNAPSNTPTR